MNDIIIIIMLVIMIVVKFGNNHASRRLPWMASISGVVSFSDPPIILTSAPFSISNCIISLCPCLLASNNGVHPLSVLLLFTNCWVILVLFILLLELLLELLLLLLSFGLSNKNWTVALCPPFAAKCKPLKRSYYYCYWKVFPE